MAAERNERAAPAGFAALAARRRGARLGHTILWQTGVDSTNDWARRLAAAGSPEGIVVVAGSQTHGRGRHGRRWESPAGLGLYCSLLLRPALEGTRLGLLALAAGVAAARAVRRTCRVAALLQWPNDLVAGGRKLGGVLVETSTASGGRAAAVVGWGLNLDHQRGDFPPPLRERATSLRLQGAAGVAPEALLGALLTEVERELEALESGAERALLRRFSDLSPTCDGAALVVEVQGRRRRATSRGLLPDGSLRVELPDGARVLRSAELLRVLEARKCSS